MSEPSTPPGPETVTRVIDKRRPVMGWPFACVCIVGIVLAAGLYCYTTERSVEALAGMGKSAERIAEKFTTGNITTTFMDEVTRIRASSGDILEVGVLESTETFTQKDVRYVLWDHLYLGTTTTEIRVPATFRYHIRLSDAWRLETRGNVCLVTAPPVRATTPVGFDTTRMEKRIDRGWARWNHTVQMNQLEEALTPGLGQRAGEKTALVKDKCRFAIAEFVRIWLLKEDHWSRDRFRSIQVVFPDEEGAIETRKSTVELEHAGEGEKR